MSKRKIELVEDEYYHIFNRGVDKRIIFSDRRDLNRFFQSMEEFNIPEPIGGLYQNSFNKKNKPLRGPATKLKKKEKLVEFIAYCLNPNHYHFILRQVADKGIEKFIHKLSTGYTRYFNLKQKRSGVLFQGPFKSVHISSNEQLLHTSVYVNLNYKVHKLKEGAKYLSSWNEYVGKERSVFCDKKVVLGQFRNKQEYINFAKAALTEIKIRKDYLKNMDE